MGKTLLTLFLFISIPVSTLFVFGQHSLPGSRRSSVELIVYKLDSKDVRNLYLKGKNLDESMLHTFIMRCADARNIPLLPRGNYIQVRVVGNKLEYSDYTIDDFYYNIVEDERVMLFLSDTLGNVINDAVVKRGLRRLKFDTTTQTYNTRRIRDQKIVEVNNDGVLHYIEFDKKPTYSYRNNFFRRSSRRIMNGLYRVFDPGSGYTSDKYDGFVVFSKPKYKPEETVRFKAYINHNGKPYNKEAEVSLVSYYPVRVDTTLTILQPYRPGMYELEFSLTDSLNLYLDNHYTVILKTKGKHTNNISGQFYFEEYELDRITFDAKAEKEKYVKGDTVKLLFNARDENGMPIYDGRVDITVRPSKRFDSKFYTDRAFVPDEIWQHSFDLNGNESEELLLPDTLFIPATGMHYDVECSFLDSGNEKQTRVVTFYMDMRTLVIDFSVTKGVLTVREFANGESVPVKAALTAFNSQFEIVSQDSVQLPYSFPLQWIVSDYKVETGASSGTLYVTDIKEDILDYRFFREKDSVRLVVDNPSEFPFWYTVRKGKSVIDKGYTTQLDYSYKDSGKNGYTMQLSYLLGGKARTITGSLPYTEKNLSMEVNTPTTVYPGQTARVDLLVRDKEGRPVKNADITAYGFTSKFGSYSPDVTIYGKSLSGKRFENRRYDLSNITPYNTRNPLEWAIWKERMGLDSIEYYKFLYPEIGYSYSEKAPGKITQISPYVVIDGNLQGVHILWIDGEAHYFHRAQQLDVYSFPVMPGYHRLKFRTYDREITVDSVYVEEGMKTILSVDGKESGTLSDVGSRWNHSPLQVIMKRHKRRDRGVLNDWEMAQLEAHMITVDNIASGITLPNDQPIYTPTIINVGSVYYWLDNSVQRRFDYRAQAYVTEPILSGPFPNLGTTAGSYPAKLYVDTTFINRFDMKGGYRYGIGKDSVQQTKWGQTPFSPRITPFIPQSSFSYHALTVESIRDMFYASLLDRMQQKTGLMISNSLVSGNDTTEVGAENLVENEFDKPILRDLVGECRLRLEIGYFADKRVTATPLMIRLFSSDNKNNIRHIYYGHTRNFDKLPEGDYQIDLVFRDTTRYSVPVTLKENGLNYLKMDSIKPMPADSIGESTFDLLYSHAHLSKPGAVLPGNTSYGGSSFGSMVSFPEMGGFYVADFTADIISGIVKDSDGEPLIGATVSVERTTNGTVTDIDGRFRLPVSSYGNLVVNYIGYQPYTIRIIPGYDYHIILEEDSQDLEEVMVIGYGVGKKGIFSGGLLGLLDMSAERKGDTDMYRSQDDELVFSRAKYMVPSGGSPDRDAFLEGWDKVNTLRRNFHDDAFWKPRISTGSDGHASFEITYPDDITSWNAHFIAVGGKKQTDKAQLKIKSFKPLNAQLSLPQFAILGDSLNVIGRLTNHLKDTVRVKRSIERQSDQFETFITLLNSHIDTIPLIANNPDSITVTYAITMEDGYFDGEQRQIPVYQTGILETHGEFAVLGDTAVRRFLTDPALGKVTVHAQSSALQSFLEEIEKIDRYPYFCNEQVASKIKALLLKKRILPMLGMEFKEERKIGRLIRRLERNRNSDDLWGWWNQDKTELWISKQIVEALLDAESDGYKVDFNKPAASVALVRQLKRRLTMAKSVNDDPFVKHQLLNVLELLRKLDAEIDYPHYSRMISSLPDNCLNDKLRSMQIALRLDSIDIKDKPRIDSLLLLSSETMLGSIYWSDDRKANSKHFLLPSTNIAENTLVVYRILREIGGYEQELQKIRNYFFEIRKNGYWQNTYESSRIMETIIPDMITPNSTFSDAKLSLNGKQYQEFPLTVELEAGEIVEVRKNGTLPLFFTVYQQAWNSVPERVSEGFAVKTSFVDQSDNTITSLEAGKSVDLKITVIAEGDADYVTIEVPIPAGCSFESKERGNLLEETHREYHKDRVVIFCHKLSEGSHDFTIKLNPRYTGHYHLNPPKAELMYFPTFFGRGETAKCEIE